MGKKSSSDDVGGSNETTEATLAALTMQISKFVSEGTLDSRFAANLVKRLKKEAEAVAEMNYEPSISAWKEASENGELEG